MTEDEKYPFGTPKRIEKQQEDESDDETNWIKHPTNPHISIHKKSGVYRTDDFTQHVNSTTKTIQNDPSVSNEPDLYDGFLTGDDYDVIV